MWCRPSSRTATTGWKTFTKTCQRINGPSSERVSGFEFRGSGSRQNSNSQRSKKPMATFKKLEEIEAWKKARQLTKKTYDVSRTGAFARDFSLRDQIRRASVSIMSNIAEGYD